MKDSALLFIVTLFFTQLGFSQQVKMIQASPDSSILFTEIGVLFQLSQNGLMVEDELPLPDKQKTDIKRGDILFGINGKTTTDVNLIRSIYEKTELDSDIKLGIKRDDSKFIVRFTKKASKNGMRIVRNDNGGPPLVSALLGLGIIAQVQKNGITVTQLLPNAQESVQKGISADDIITAINGKTVKTDIEVENLLNNIKTDDLFKLTFKHGDAEKTIEVKKVEFKFQKRTH
jgi:S1-C subfamily serine protease